MMLGQLVIDWLLVVLEFGQCCQLECDGEDCEQCVVEEEWVEVQVLDWWYGYQFGMIKYLYSRFFNWVDVCGIVCLGVLCS